MIDKIEYHLQELLKALYHDEILLDPNFQDTPKRMARMYLEFLKFRNENIRTETIQRILSSSFPCTHDSMIFAPNIKAFSLCPHHFLPVKYTITIGYIPVKDGKVIGASKLERIARVLSKSAILQEDLTVEIADVITQGIKTQGCAVVVSGEHDCMQTRGIHSIGSFETSEMRGAFRDNQATREEFFHLLQYSRR